MTTFTKERAFCMLFFKPYNEENVIKLATLLEKEKLARIEKKRWFYVMV
jgi:hypothetical protein